MKFLIVLILLVNVAWAQLQSEKVVSVTLKDGTTEEAKSILLHTAIMETIRQYSSEMNLDVSAFNKKLNDKFEAYFIDFKQRELSTKFGKNFSTELSPEQKQAFEDSLELRKEREFVRFARLSELVDQYSFKTIEKEKDDPSNWKAVVVLNLNRPKFDRYSSRLLSDEKKQFEKIFLISELNLIGFAWPELGVENEKSFNDPLMNSWNKWFLSNQPTNVGDVVPCSGSCFNGFTSWLQLPQEENMQVPPDFAGSLWVKVSINLRKVSYIPDIKEWSFEWDGTVVVLNANNKMVLGSYTLLPESKTWRNLDQKALNSAIASSIYRSPLDAFSKAVKRVQEAPVLNRLVRLGVKGYRNLDDVLALEELLKKEGQSLQLDLRLDNFSSNEAQLLCFYQGEEKAFVELLGKIKTLKAPHSFSVVNEFSGVHHVLKLVAE